MAGCVWIEELERDEEELPLPLVVGAVFET
jgi:hypothetical protein